jgi:hypothetical protein
MAHSYPNDADGDALRKVASNGADMSKPMVIDFSVAAPNQDVARRVAELVVAHGFQPSISADEQGGGWSVYCSKSMRATYDGVLEAQRCLNELLRPIGAICDGWGTFGNAQAGRQ